MMPKPNIPCIHAFLFFIRKFFENEPRKPKNLKKMLRNFPGLNACAAIFLNTDFCQSLKVTKFSIFQPFFLIQNSFLSSYLMVVAPLLALSLRKQTFKENKKIKEIKKISALFQYYVKKTQTQAKNWFAYKKKTCMYQTQAFQMLEKLKKRKN